jgi:hypothetical protein
MFKRADHFIRSQMKLQRSPGQSHLGLLQFRLRHFRGPSLLLADNTRIERGTIIFVPADDDGRFNNALQAAEPAAQRPIIYNNSQKIIRKCSG